MLASIARALPTLVVIALSQVVASFACASSVVTVPFVLPLANTAGQEFDISVSGDDMIDAVDLFMVINGGVGPAPVITAIDVTGPGTIFFGNNTGQGYFTPPGQLPGLTPAVATTTVSGKILADGLLAHVTFDTTGIPAGVYTISLTSHVFGPTNFGTDANFDFIFPLVIDGTFGVPEPSALAISGMAAIGLALLRYRRRPVTSAHPR